MSHTASLPGFHAISLKSVCSRTGSPRQSRANKRSRDEVPTRAAGVDGAAKLVTSSRNECRSTGTVQRLRCERETGNRPLSPHFHVPAESSSMRRSLSNAVFRGKHDQIKSSTSVKEPGAATDHGDCRNSRDVWNDARTDEPSTKTSGRAWAGNPDVPRDQQVGCSRAPSSCNSGGGDKKRNTLVRDGNRSCATISDTERTSAPEASAHAPKVSGPCMIERPPSNQVTEDASREDRNAQVYAAAKEELLKGSKRPFQDHYTVPARMLSPYHEHPPYAASGAADPHRPSETNRLHSAGDGCRTYKKPEGDSRHWTLRTESNVDIGSLRKEFSRLRGEVGQRRQDMEARVCKFAPDTGNSEISSAQIGDRTIHHPGCEALKDCNTGRKDAHSKASLVGGISGGSADADLGQAVSRGYGSTHGKTSDRKPAGNHADDGFELHLVRQFRSWCGGSLRPQIYQGQPCQTPIQSRCEYEKATHLGRDYEMHRLRDTKDERRIKSSPRHSPSARSLRHEIAPHAVDDEALHHRSCSNSKDDSATLLAVQSQLERAMKALHKVHARAGEEIANNRREIVNLKEELAAAKDELLWATSSAETNAKPSNVRPDSVDVGTCTSPSLDHQATPTPPTLVRHSTSETPASGEDVRAYSGHHNDDSVYRDGTQAMPTSGRLGCHAISPIATATLRQSSSPPVGGLGSVGATASSPSALSVLSSPVLRAQDDDAREQDGRKALATSDHSGRDMKRVGGLDLIMAASYKLSEIDSEHEVEEIKDRQATRDVETVLENAGAYKHASAASAALSDRNCDIDRLKDQLSKKTEETQAARRELTSLSCALEGMARQLTKKDVKIERQDDEILRLKQHVGHHDEQ